MGSGEALNDQEIVTLSSLLGRSRLSRAIRGGKQFDGERDMYETLGYPQNIQFEAYVEKYKRQDVAGKVVDLPAQDTWRKPPVIKDGEEDSTMEQPQSEFLQGVRYLVEKRRLWHYLQRVDRLAGIGRYGVLLIGTVGATDMASPLEANTLKQPSDVLYFSVFSEGSAQITALETDTQNERYGLPKFYMLQMGQGLASITAHWSRVLHVADDLLEDDIYGLPRLERVYNRLEDLLKVAGGGAEANWKNMDRGLHADVQPDFELTKDDAEQLSDEITEYIHGLRRFIRTQGVNLKELGSEVIDPEGMFKTLIALISAATDIPQRILLGSERGELASSQDQATWAGAIASRQTQFAEPSILRPMIDRLIAAGALPRPKSGKYSAQWASLFELNELEKAKVAETYSNAIKNVAPPGAPEVVVTPEEFRERLLGWAPAEVTEESILDEEDAQTGLPEGDDDDGDTAGSDEARSN